MGIKIVIDTSVNRGNFEFRTIESSYYMGYIQNADHHYRCIWLKDTQELADLKSLCEMAMAQIEKDRIEVENFKKGITPPPPQEKQKFLGIF
jgi:hypothetical protein